MQKNFTFTNTDGTSECHVIPMGGDLRGMFVNKTLLKSLGLSVPKNRADFLACSKVLLAKGYIPMQANPGTAGQTFLYPYICNQITGSSDYQATYQRVENREAGISELFREPYQFFYDYVSQGYYDYTAAKTTPWANDFGSQTETGLGRLFFNIHDDGTGTYTKVDDLGNIAFLPQALSISNTMAKVKDDYHSSIDYEFILSPVGTTGGYAYLSPAKGIGISKGTSQKEWTLEFLNFFFSATEQTKFSSLNGTVPNNTGWKDYLSKTYSINSNSISDVGQVTFSYSFYYVVISQLVEMAKINAEKYMIDDGNGNKIMKPFSTFMTQLEDAFQNPDKYKK